MNNWFKTVFDGWSIRVNSDREPYQLELYKDEISINLVDTGQGICQFIPIAVHCFTETEKNTLSIKVEGRGQTQRCFIAMGAATGEGAMGSRCRRTCTWV